MLFALVSTHTGPSNGSKNCRCEFHCWFSTSQRTVIRGTQGPRQVLCNAPQREFASFTSYIAGGLHPMYDQQPQHSSFSLDISKPTKLNCCSKIVQEKMAASATAFHKPLDREESLTKKDLEILETTPTTTSPALSIQVGEKNATLEEGYPVAPFSPSREVLFVLVICMAQFLSLAGLAQSIAPLEITGKSFGVTSEAALSWYPASFSLTYGTFILPAGRLVSSHRSKLGSNC